MKNILVTGATGYLGSALVRNFVNEQNYNVTILIRQRSSIKRIEDIIGHIKIIHIENINYCTLFKEGCFDAVIHTATSYGRKGESRLEIFNTNVHFPFLLLSNALKHGVKYFLNANTTLNPEINFYAFSKKQFSDLLKFYSGEINILDLELEYFYGPNDDNSKFVNYILSEYKNNSTLINLSPCTQIRDFIYIDDVVSAYSKLLKFTDNFKGYNLIPIGSGYGTKLMDLVLKISKHFPSSQTILKFGALPLRENEITYSVADTNILINLGWSSKFNVDEGLNRMIYIENTTSKNYNL